MMGGLFARVEAIARAAQVRRLEQILAGVRATGLPADIEDDSVVVRGRRFVQRWLGDPALRFLGRTGS